MDHIAFWMTEDEVKELQHIAERAEKPFDVCVAEALDGYRGPDPKPQGGLYADLNDTEGHLRPATYLLSDKLVPVEASVEDKRQWSGARCRLAIREYFRRLQQEKYIGVPLGMMRQNKGA